MVPVVVLLVVVALGLAVALVVERRSGRERQAAGATEIERLTGELTAVTARAQSAEVRAEQLEQRVSEAEARAALAEDAHVAAVATRRVTDDRRAIADKRLWSLEMARAERTWRHSVSIFPGAPSPLVDATDPLRTAVEIEAAALHEDTGAPLDVRWEVTVDSPARDLLVLRTAQELLAIAAHEGTDVTLHAEAGDDDTTVLSLTPADDSTQIDLTELSERLALTLEASRVRLTTT